MASEQDEMDTTDLVPPTPLGGEADAGEAPGLGGGARDETIPTPLPEFPGQDQNRLKSAADVEGIKGFTRTSDDAPTSGVGNVEDRGTTAGVGTASEGAAGGGLEGMKGTESTDQRTTRPLSKQGSVTGVNDVDES